LQNLLLLRIDFDVEFLQSRPEELSEVEFLEAAEELIDRDVSMSL
jgi:hypothetical protein